MKALLILLFALPLIGTSSVPYWWETYDVKLRNKKNGEELATYSDLKDAVEKTILYFNASFENGANEKVTSLPTGKWAQSKSSAKNFKVKDLKKIATPLYDNLLEAHPRTLNKFGFETSWNTQWMMNVTPFYKVKQLIGAAKAPKSPRKAVFNEESHYPWDKEGKIIKNGSKVTIDLLKYIFSFELPETKDKNERKIIEVVGDPIKEYRYYEPTNVKKSEKLPLYVFLTGDGDYGHDPTRWARQGKQRAFCIEVKHAVNQNINFIIDTIASFSKRPNVDAKRVYVLGFSRGGISIMDLINRRPDLIAVAWIMDPGSYTMALPDNPFKTPRWFQSDFTRAQKKFATKLKKHNVTVIISPASSYTIRAICTPEELVKIYTLLAKNGVKVYYGPLPRHHGPAQQAAFLDFRFWNFISSIRK